MTDTTNDTYDNYPRRVTFLADAIGLVSGERDEQYGKPIDNLTATAILFSAYIYAKYAGEIIDPLSFNLTAEDIAWLNVLQKISRTFNGVVKPDTYTDAAGYSALAGECAEEAGA